MDAESAVRVRALAIASSDRHYSQGAQTGREKSKSMQGLGAQPKREVRHIHRVPCHYRIAINPHRNQGITAAHAL